MVSSGPGSGPKQPFWKKLWRKLQGLPTDIRALFGGICIVVIAFAFKGIGWMLHVVAPEMTISIKCLYVLHFGAAVAATATISILILISLSSKLNQFLSSLTQRTQAANQRREILALVHELEPQPALLKKEIGSQRSECNAMLLSQRNKCEKTRADQQRRCDKTLESLKNMMTTKRVESSLLPDRSRDKELPPVPKRGDSDC